MSKQKHQYKSVIDDDDDDDDDDFVDEKPESKHLKQSDLRTYVIELLFSVFCII